MTSAPTKFELTTREDLRTPLFWKRVLIGLAMVVGTYVFSALFPHYEVAGLVLLLFVVLPGSSYPYDIVGALMGPMLIGISTGAEWHKYSLAFNLATLGCASLVLGALGVVVARLTIREMRKMEPKVPEGS